MIKTVSMLYVEVFSAKMSDDLNFCSRRSPVICNNGCVASSQPLASQIGIGKLFWARVVLYYDCTLQELG
jgi:hypothetical protein